MSNPYQPGSTDQPGKKPKLVPRMAVLSIYFVAWIVFAVLLGPGLRMMLGLKLQESMIPENALGFGESLTRFNTHFWFSAPIILGLPFGIVTWVALGLKSDHAVIRWKWLVINIIAIPALLILNWFMFRKMLFLP